MKTLGALLAMVLIAGAFLVSELGRRRPSVSGPAPVASPGDEHATVAPPPRQSRRLPVKPRSVTPSPAGAESAPPKKLPLSVAEVPLTPKLDEAYQELYKTFGPGITTWINNKLARRAELAKCGINEPGAAKFVLRSQVDHENGTQKIDQLVGVVTSFQGEMDDIVVRCIHDAVMGKVEKYTSETPDWFAEEVRQEWKDNPLLHEIDTVSFPIENDELYKLFTDARASAYQESETKAQYGWK
jgi:hypothetical protein